MGVVMFVWMHDGLGEEVTEDYHGLRPSVDKLFVRKVGMPRAYPTRIDAYSSGASG